jgi:Ca-activated chloride channel homolog
MKQPVIEFVPLKAAVASDAESTLDLLVRVLPPSIGMAVTRPGLNLGLAIDRSGSMAGQKQQFALEAACYAVEQLLPGDRVAVTIFDDKIETIVPNTVAENKAAICSRIRQVYARGSTALHGGWTEAGMQVAGHLNPSCLNRVILLTDGLANVGETNADRIGSDVSGLSSRGVGTSAMGIGEDYDEDLLEAMARSGDGNFYHIQSVDQLPLFFGAELQGLAGTLGAKVSLGINTPQGVEVKDVLNDLDKTEYGRLKLPNLVLGYPIVIAFRLKVRPQRAGADLCAFRLAWDDPKSGRRQELRLAFRLPAVPSADLGSLPSDPAVEEQFAILLAARARKEAIHAIDAGDMVRASSLIGQQMGVMESLPESDCVSREFDALRELQSDLANADDKIARKKMTYQRFNTQRGKRS